MVDRMPKTAPEMTALQVKTLSKPGTYPVGSVPGLLIRVKPSGAKNWVLRATVGKKRRDIGLGGYPAVTLADARARARADRDRIREGLDPVLERRAARSTLEAAQAKQLSFEDAARRWHKEKAKEFRNAKHAEDWIRSLEMYAFPKLGRMLLPEIELAHVVQVLEPIWTTKTETASRLRQRLESVLGWATVHGYRTGENPARWQGYLDKVLPAPAKVKKSAHYKAIPWEEVGSFMAELRKRDGMAARALEFQALTAARTGAVRGATWDEIYMEARTWTVPVERPAGRPGTKLKRKHVVHLSAPALALLESLPRTRGVPFLFTNRKGGPLTDMALLAVMRRMRDDGAVPHGLRSCFKDWTRSRSSFADEVSEMCLAHVSSDATRAAYARDMLLPQRAKLLEAWAEFLSRSHQSGAVVNLEARKHA